MRISCFLKIFVLLLSFSIHAQNDTIFIESGFKKVNVFKHSKVYSASTFSNQKDVYEKHLEKTDGDNNFFYYDFNSKFNYLSFTIKNETRGIKDFVIVFSNPLISEITSFRKRDNGTFTHINTTGIDYLFSTRLEEHRKFLFPISLDYQEQATYMFQLKKQVGRPLVTSVNLFNRVVFEKENFKQNLAVGIYYGLSLLSILFCLFAYFVLRQSSYILYALYIIALGLYISSYLGIFYQLFVSSDAVFKMYANYVLYSELSLLLFILLSQKILNARITTPKLNMVINVLIGLILTLRFLLHFVFSNLFSEYVPVFMIAWYFFILVATFIVILQVIAYYRTNKSRTSFFAIAYLFMIIGAVFTVLHHSFGLVNTLILRLPFIFYTSILEILFLTFTMIYMVKEIYDERNHFSEVILKQQKKILSAFVEGEEKERQRIGNELHDNIGSKLGALKMAIINQKEESINAQIDDICDDVRSLSHEIAPSGLKLVKFVDAVNDLIKTRNYSPNVSINLQSYNFPDSLSDHLSHNLYRIIQEGLHNIFKHAKASQIDIQLFGHDDSILVSIEDNGKGFNPKSNFKGSGINNMNYRVSQINGVLTIDSSINNGTILMITVPYA